MRSARPAVAVFAILALGSFAEGASRLAGTSLFWRARTVIALHVGECRSFVHRGAEVPGVEDAFFVSEDRGDACAVTLRFRGCGLMAKRARPCGPAALRVLFDQETGLA